MMSVASFIPFPFSAPCNDMIAILICATRWLPMHLYTLAYMSMHEFCLLVCHLYFNTMKLWTPNPNLHLSFADTTFCLFACYFVCFHISPACLLSHALLAMPILLIHFMPFHMLLASFPSIACLLVSCLCLCMYAYRARMLGARTRSPKHK